MNKERNVALTLKAQGYAHVVQIETVRGPFGKPLFFKSSNEVGPLLRGFTAQENAKVAWSKKIDDYIAEQEE